MSQNELRNPSWLEQYNQVILNARELGRFGSGMQTPLHRIVAALAGTMLPASTDLNSSPANEAEMNPYLRNQLGVQAPPAPDLFDVLSSPSFHNALITGGLGALFGARGAMGAAEAEAPGMTRPPGPGYAPNLPKIVRESHAVGKPASPGHRSIGPAINWGIRDEHLGSFEGRMRTGYPRVPTGGAASEPLVAPGNATRGVLANMSDEDLRAFSQHIRNKIMNSSGKEYHELVRLHQDIVKEMGARIGPHEVPPMEAGPSILNLPPEKIDDSLSQLTGGELKSLIRSLDDQLGSVEKGSDAFDKITRLHRRAVDKANGTFGGAPVPPSPFDEMSPEALTDYFNHLSPDEAKKVLEEFRNRINESKGAQRGLWSRLYGHLDRTMPLERKGPIAKGPRNVLPPSRFGVTSPNYYPRDLSIEQELTKASSRVDAKARAAAKKAAELQSPAEEGSKLGPLPHMPEIPVEDITQLKMDIERIDNQLRGVPLDSPKYKELVQQQQELIRRWKLDQIRTGLHPGSFPAGPTMTDQQFREMGLMDKAIYNRSIINHPITSERYIRQDGKWYKIPAEGEQYLVPPEEGSTLGPLPPIGEASAHGQTAEEWMKAAREMSDMDLMARAAQSFPDRNLQWRKFVIAELQRRGIIPPGTRF